MPYLTINEHSIARDYFHKGVLAERRRVLRAIDNLTDEDNGEEYDDALSDVYTHVETQNESIPQMFEDFTKSVDS